MGQYTKEMHEAFRKEQDEKAAKEAEERREQMEKASARLAWLGDGGNARDFEREWPSLRDQARRQRVMHADRKAREEMRAHGPNRI
jgi:hypothetical protein